ncbi:MAG: phosphoribosylformylglycinamidine synthase subunit PurQ [Phycisphaerales bacterium]
MTITNTSQPRALIVTAAGINCDRELGRAFELAGATATFMHLNQLIAQPSLIGQFDLIGIPGGFSFGDAIAAGRVMAQLMRRHLYQPLIDAIARGTPIFAPCNGFQILCQMGLLPGPSEGDDWPAQPPVPVVSLAPNVDGRFVDRWTRIEIPESHCMWTQGLDSGMIPSDDAMQLPSAHGEGRLIAHDADFFGELEERGQVAIRYHADDNFNGSTAAIAGLCDATGLVFGLMPHPERFVSWQQHPYWTRLDRAAMRAGTTIGLQMFRSAVNYVRERQGAAPALLPQ